MLKYAVVHRALNVLVKIMSDNEWQEYDVRQYDVMLLHKYKNKIDPVPVSLIKALRIGKNNELEEIYYPIFDLQDLDKIFISSSGHFVLKNELTLIQQLWIELNHKGRELIS